MSKYTSKLFGVALGVCLLICSGFLVGEASAKENVLRLGVGVDATTLDPHNYKGGVDLLVDFLIYDTLVAFDVNLKLIPGLATSWENLDDTTWRFKLRQGVKFQDGTPFNAQAAKINLDRMRQAPRGKPYYGMIDAVTIEDDYTIIVKTKTASAPFLTNLCEAVGGMVSPKAIEQYGENLGTHPVGTGRFELESWRPKEKLVLKRNENYWGEKAKLDRFVLRPIPEEGTRDMAFASGEIDVISDPLPHRIARYKADKNVKVLTAPSTRTVWIGFNASDKVLKNVKLRQAIGYAINRDEIVEYIVENLALNAQAIIPPIIMKPKTPHNFPFDPAKAKKLLAEAGYPDGLTLNLWTCEGRYLKDRQIAEAVQAQLAKVGIKTKLQVMEWGAYLDALFRHEQQLYVIGWGFNAGNPDSALRSCFHSGSKFNFSAYEDPQINALLDKAVATLDAGKRYELYETIQEKLIDDAALVPIYHKLEFYAASAKVKDFYPHPMELIDISRTTVD